MMKILFLLFTFCCGFAQAQVSFLGFDRDYCPDALSISYTYENFSLPGGSSAEHGFRILRDGVQVYSQQGSMNNSTLCLDLYFVNDAVGFIVIQAPGGGKQVLRTQDYGNNWQIIGGGAPNYLGLYVLNDWTAYLVTQWDFPKQLCVCRCSDQLNNINNSVIYDTIQQANIAVTDVLLNPDRCGADSLVFAIWNGTDTITYQINFNLLNAGSSEAQTDQLLSYPNPASDIFKLSTTEALEWVQLFDLSGQLVQDFCTEALQQKQFSVATIPNGTYFVQVKSNATFFNLKLLVHH